MAKGFMDSYSTYNTEKGFGNSKKWQQLFEERLNFKTVTALQEDTNKNILAGMYAAQTGVELKKEYYRLMNLYHPDKAGDTEENKTISQIINNTYFKLKR